MSYGFLSLVLHCHLPFVRHPEYDRFLEEAWLYEAIGETYLPLLRVFDRLKNDHVPFRLTMSVSPTLAAMLTDELLQNRYAAHCGRLIDLAEHELRRTATEPALHEVAAMYRDLHRRNLHDFAEVHKKNLVRTFKALEKEGNLEIITTAATHCFLPLYQLYPHAVDMQIHTAILSHGRIFGTTPKGFWLPECGYYPNLERHLKAHGLSYFYTAAHGLLFARGRSPYGVYSALTCPNGVAAFGRDIPSSQAVWSAEDGYPGDSSYRDFYRDIGFDLPIDYIRPWIHEGDIRINTGLKYYAVTGKTDHKVPYAPAVASGKAEEHAANFLYNRRKQISKLARLMDRPPIILCPYDAELLGHWWFEGPQWLEFLLRKIHAEGRDIVLVTASDYLAQSFPAFVGSPIYSSWGNNGFGEVWLDGSNDWIYRHTHKAVERMSELVARFPDETGLKRRALNQAAREVLLSQASDWPFIMKMKTTVGYAVQRIREHLQNFTTIYDGLRRSTVNTEWLTRVEKKNSIFPDIDYRLFAESGGTREPAPHP